MPSLTSSRTTRRLFRLASLGLAGLLAGLLSGCNASSNDGDNGIPYTHISNEWEFTPSTTPGTQHLGPPESIEARQIPALRHAPSARRLQYGSLTPTRQTIFPRHSDRS